MAWLIWRKLEMTRISKENKMIPVTLIKVPEIKVFQVKTKENDWYEALVLEINEHKKPYRKEVTIDSKNSEFKTWDIVTLDILEWVNIVDVTGISKWKWFAWAMKRWNFSWGPWRVGSKFHRALWSIGTRKPRRTKPGKKMHWHMGTDTITLKDISVEIINKDLNVVALKGPVPGARNSYVTINF